MSSLPIPPKGAVRVTDGSQLDADVAWMQDAPDGGYGYNHRRATRIREDRVPLHPAYLGMPTSDLAVRYANFTLAPKTIHD